MRKLSILVALLGCSALCGCSTQQMQQIATVACAADPVANSALKAGSVIATIVDPATVGAVAVVNAVDAAAHPAVVAACAAALPGSTPVPQTVQISNVPVAPQSSLTTAVIFPVSAPVVAPAQ